MEIEITSRFLSNMIGNCNHEISCPHTLLLTNREVAILHKDFETNSLVNKNSSKIQISKMM